MLGTFFNLIRLVGDHYVMFEYDLFWLLFRYSFVLFFIDEKGSYLV